MTLDYIVMVYSLLWVMQDLYHYGIFLIMSNAGLFLSSTVLYKVWKSSRRRRTPWSLAVIHRTTGLVETLIRIMPLLGSSPNKKRINLPYRTNSAANHGIASLPPEEDYPAPDTLLPFRTLATLLHPTSYSKSLGSGLTSGPESAFAQLLCLGSSELSFP